ncbi:MAG TPA: LuxR C-terminal-related transcriptional regulator [Candidatus Limnocylindrales bacterium]|nr:LuxR C-terminal-related transcriptional regulator [Candidatus Limnocylindrales bacterium]
MARRSRGRPPHPDVLTPTEWSVLDMYRHGLTRRTIAAMRGISEYGVRYHLRNIAGKLGVEGTTALRAWPGFPSTSAMASRRGRTMSEPVQLGPLGQVSLYARDAAATEAWYRDVLKLPEVFRFGDLVFFDCGGVRLYIHAVGDEKWRPSSVLYFLVPDIHAAHAELTGRGIDFRQAPHMIFKHDATGVEEWLAFFDDPDGNMLAITAHVAPEAAVAA